MTSETARREASIATYGVVGHPVAHSLSPDIQAAFADAAGIALAYRRVPAPLDAFVETVDAFFAAGGRGLNVTLPFKLEAFAACGAHVSARAREAGAVNWLVRDGHEPHGHLRGDNTDGVGLVRDLARLLGRDADPLAGKRVLLIGAGGAARGVVGPLLASRPRSLSIVNRDVDKARRMVAGFADVRLDASGFAALEGREFDVVVNATSASLAGVALPLPPSVFASAALAYDMMYGASSSGFLVDAAGAGARITADGLGMLVEQAAESFRLWHGVMPDTAPVLAMLGGGVRR